MRGIERPVPESGRALPARRGRVAVAAAVSLLLHAGLALAFVRSWSSGDHVDVGGSAMEVTLVAGPLGGTSGQDGPDDTKQGGRPGEGGEKARTESHAKTAPPAPAPRETAESTPAKAKPAPGQAEAPVPPAKPEIKAPPTRTAEPALPPPPPKPRPPARTTIASKTAPQPGTEAAAKSPEPRFRAEGDKTRADAKTASRASPHPARQRQLASLNPAPGASAGGSAGAGDGEPKQGTKGAGRKAAAPLAGNPAPGYPRLARRRGWEGRVVLDVAVGPDGTVAGLEVAESSGYAALDEAAAAAVRDWRFTPASRGGQSVADTVRVPIRFDLRDDT